LFQLLFIHVTLPLHRCGGASDQDSREQDTNRLSSAYHTFVAILSQLQIIRLCVEVLVARVSHDRARVAHCEREACTVIFAINVKRILGHHLNASGGGFIRPAPP
jgi:hypothetical protein